MLSETGISFYQEEATLNGETEEGEHIVGSDNFTEQPYP
jgi:hypothetical protein